VRRTKEPLIYSDAVDGIAAETYATIAHGAELYGVLPSELVAWVIRSLKKFAIADLRGRLAEHEHDADDAEGRLLRKAEGVTRRILHIT